MSKDKNPPVLEQHPEVQDKNPLGLEQNPKNQDHSLKATSEMIANEPQIRTPDFIRHSGAKQTQKPSAENGKPAISASITGSKAIKGFVEPQKPRGNRDGR